MSENKLPELADTQLALLVKTSLDYASTVIRDASFIYGQDLKDSVRKRFAKNFNKLATDYNDRLKEILGEQDGTN